MFKRSNIEDNKNTQSVLNQSTQTHRAFTGKAEVLSSRGLVQTHSANHRSHRTYNQVTRDRAVIVAGSLRRIIVVEGWLCVCRIR